MAQPTQAIIDIAQDDVNLPSTGNPNKLEPNVAVQNTGWDDGQPVEAEDLNYIFHNFSTWLKYFRDNESEIMDAIQAARDVNLTAGNGLTGGGNLNEDRTFTLGTPSTLSASTTNSVTDESHTHALSIATQAEAQGGTDDTKLMTSLRTRENVVNSFTQNFNSSKGSCTLPNGLIINWGTETLGGNGVWVEGLLDTPYTTAHMSITLGINAAVGGEAVNSNVSIRSHSSTPLTKFEYQQRGQTGTITYISLGY